MSFYMAHNITLSHVIRRFSERVGKVNAQWKHGSDSQPDARGKKAAGAAGYCWYWLGAAAVSATAAAATTAGGVASWITR